MKKFISLLCAFSLFLCTISFPLFLYDTLTVSALSSDTSIYITSGFTNINRFNSHQKNFLQSFAFPSGTFQIITSRSLETGSDSSVSGNTGVLSFDLNSMHNWGTVVKDGTTFILYVNRSSRESIPDYIPEFYDFQGDLVRLSNQTFFVALPINNYNYAYMHNFNNGMMNGQDGYLDQFSNFDIIFWSDASIISLSYNTFFLENNLPVTPDNPIVYPLYESTYSLSIQKDKFVEWLLSTGRYVEIAESLSSNRVSGFVDVFADYGGNTRSFITNVKKFFQFIGIGQTISDYNAVLTKTQSLYRDYQHYIRQLLIDKYNDRTQNTSDIKPDTSSDNTSLITNSVDDTVTIRILRDILRSLIALPNNISNLIESFEIKVEGLENTVNVVNQSGIPDISSLWSYSESDFDVDVENFANDVSEVQQLPLSYLANINNNSLMPEKMLSDKEDLTVNIPNISGFTVSDNGKTFSTQTTSYVVSSNDYPWLDPLVKKIKRFSGILLILGYLVHLRNKLPDIVRGE